MQRPETDHELKSLYERPKTIVLRKDWLLNEALLKLETRQKLKGEQNGTLRKKNK